MCFLFYLDLILHAGARFFFFGILNFATKQGNVYICSLNAVAVLTLDWQFGMSEPRSCKVPFRQLAGMSLFEPSAKSLRETSKFQQIP